MVTEYHKTRKVSLFTLPGFFIAKSFLVISIILLLNSCMFYNYKSDITKETNSIMNNLKTGEFKDIPGLGKYILTLDDSQSNEILTLFRSIENWEISDIKRINDNVNVSIKFKILKEYKYLNLAFIKSGKKWLPKENISFSQTIDYIPLENN